jgi:hypothetical protein
MVADYFNNREQQISAAFEYGRTPAPEITTVELCTVY